MARALCGLMVALVSVAISPGWSAAITVNPFTINMLRDVRSVNNIGIAAGDLVQYGADVQGGSAGTFISAFHSSGFTDAAVPCGPLVINANFCAGVFLFDSSRLDDWTIRFTKTGEAPLDVAAPSLNGAAAIPFPVSVTIAPGANPTTPTISWGVPAGFAPDAFRVNIFDRDAPVGINGVSAQIGQRPDSAR